MRFVHVDHSNHQLIDVNRDVIFDLTDLKYFLVDFGVCHASDPRDLDAVIVEQGYVDDAL
jgi:hypothetical protein